MLKFSRDESRAHQFTQMEQVIEVFSKFSDFICLAHSKLMVGICGFSAAALSFGLYPNLAHEPWLRGILIKSLLNRRSLLSIYQF